METYSHSKLDVYRKCPLQFKQKYIDKIKGEEDKSASDFGNTCHYIAENYKGGGKQELLKLYKDVVPEKYKITDAYKKKLPLAFRNIHECWNKFLSKHKVSKEREITIKLNENILLTGKIDAVYRDIDKIKIIDYKTSKSNKYSNFDNQLSMYFLLMNRHYRIPFKALESEIIYLALDAEDKYKNKILNEGYENILKKCKVTEDDINCLISEIETIHNKIEKSKATNQWKALPTKFNCTYCPYKKDCKEKYKED